MDISNKSLALILVAAIVVSLGGTLVSMNRLNQFSMPMSGVTGFASYDTGEANLTISGKITISIEDDQVIDFGAGYVDGSNAGIQYCKIDTYDRNATLNATNFCIGFSNVSADPGDPGFTNDKNGPFKIVNDGNQDVFVYIQSNATPEQFIGSPSTTGVVNFTWMIDSNTTGSACTGGTNNVSSWREVTTTQRTYVCGSGEKLKFADGSDAVYLHLQVQIPEDVRSQSNARATITATGTAT